MKVIGYCRVSTDEQGEKGFSLRHQEEAIRKFCDLHDHQLIEVYHEEFTGFKDFQRPQWQKIENYIRKNKRAVEGILCLRWDRFSRNEPEAGAKVREFRKKGIEIFMMESYHDPNEIEGDLLNSLHMHLAQIESRKISKRTIEGSRRAMKEGCWVFRAPFGYLSHRDSNGKSTLIPHPQQSQVVKEVYEKMASGMYHAETLRKKYFDRLERMSKQNFLYLLRRIIFTGKVEVKATKTEPKIIVEGLHEPIISPELFNKVQEVLDGKKSSLTKVNNAVDLYPLKGYLYCANHDRTFTASGSRGRNAVHHYYHCTCGKCKHRFNVKKMNDKVLELISQLNFPNEILDLYDLILKDSLSKRQAELIGDSKEIDDKINKNLMRKEKLEEDYLDGKINPENFQALSLKINVELEKLKSHKILQKNESIPFKKLINESLRIIPNLPQYFEQADGETKQMICGSIFSGKIEFLNNEVRTVPWKPFIAQILLIDRQLEGFKKEKVGKIADQSSMAPPLGLEPRTL